MDDLRAKWSSRRGESLVLALLFLLVCMMVAASVLMAAASNAGKIRSNRQEQQRYLTMSSALQLVCDELNAAKYCGRYQCDAVPVMKLDEDGQWVVDYYIYKFTQLAGSFQCELKEGSPAEVLPLSGDLDKLAGNNFQVKATSPGNVIDPFVSLTVPSGQLGPHTITLTVDMSDSGQEDYSSSLLAEVTVTVEVDTGGGPRAGVIDLAAELKETDEYGNVITMRAEAELKPEPQPQNVFGISSLGTGIFETAPMSWTLDWIKKVE